MPTSNSNVYIWSAIERIMVSAIGLGGNIVLANLLSPNDFGMLAMVAIFSAIAYNLSSCGLSDGLIRKEKPTEHDYSTVMVFNGALGLLFCIVFIAIAKPLSIFFNQPPLINIMTCIGICFFFQTLTFVQETRLRKLLKMKRLCIIHVLASFSSFCLGLYLALEGYGYWALVSTQVFLSLFLFIYFMIIERWLPRIAFYKDSFNNMFGFGFNLMLSYLLTATGKNISNFFLGRLSVSSAGFFSQAQKMEEVPFSFTEVTFCNSFFPILSNEPDTNKKKELCDNMTSWMSLLNISIALLLILLSAPGFNLLYEHKWDNSIPVFRVLVIFGAIYSLKQFFQTILKSYGYAKQIRNLTIAELLLQILLLIVALPYGLIVVAWSQTVAIIIIYLTYLVYYSKICQIPLLRIFKQLITPLIIPLLSFIITGIGYIYGWEDLDPLPCCIINSLGFSALCIIGWEMYPHSIYLKYRTLLLDRLFHKQ